LRDDLDTKLARLGQRITQGNADNRARLDRMGFHDAAALRDRFGGRLRYLSDRDGSTGSSVIDGCDLMQPGVGWTEYIPPKTRRSYVRARGADGDGTG
jgi:hypothetical protein